MKRAKREGSKNLAEFLFDLYGVGNRFRIGRTVAAKVCDELPKFNRARLDRGESAINFILDGQDAVFAAESTDGGAQSHAETGDARARGFQRCL
ncbi:MAG TPA: hypothetical protein VMV59_04970 [Candidatus Dormibacteraeota bacterium]|nr:hypothetical protein [Candidatus Dormibacteraeota bacterium]